MHTILLAQDFTAYSTNRLAAALETRGHQVQRVMPTQCSIRVDGLRSDVFHEGHSLLGADLVLLRCVAFSAFGLNVVRLFETAVATQLLLSGSRCVNEPLAKQLAQDKFFSLQALDRAGIPVPASWLTWSPESLERIAADHLGTPLVLKAMQGSWGVGVMRADSIPSARSIFETIGGLQRAVIAQRYVHEAGRRDLRAIVLGDQVVGAFRRAAAAGEFRANIHRGAQPEIVTLDSAYQAAAVQATHCLGLALAGVDLLETPDGPLVLEVNPTPGWQQIERLSDLDVAGQVVRYLERI